MRVPAPPDRPLGGAGCLPSSLSGRAFFLFHGRIRHDAAPSPSCNGSVTPHLRQWPGSDTAPDRVAHTAKQENSHASLSYGAGLPGFQRFHGSGRRSSGRFQRPERQPRHRGRHRPYPGDEGRGQTDHGGQSGHPHHCGRGRLRRRRAESGRGPGPDRQHGPGAQGVRNQEIRAGQLSLCHRWRGGGRQSKKSGLRTEQSPTQRYLCR